MLQRRVKQLLRWVVMAGVAAGSLCLSAAAPPSTRPAPRLEDETDVLRPILSDAEYAEQAAKLRERYSKPIETWGKAEVDASVTYREMGLLPAVEHPADNAYSKAKADLGKQLFFDPRLSGSSMFACASCHDPDLGWTDGKTLSFGHERQPTKRNAPSILNVAYHETQFWDGRAKTLEDQVSGPILAENEMHSDPDLVVKRIAGQPEYAKEFAEVFGDAGVTTETIAKAIACFERTIVGGRSRFDAFLKGNKKALTDAALRGLQLYRHVGNCMNCHNGPNFTDNEFHNIGLSYYGRSLQDLGRYEQTKKPEDVGAFRTPSLRNVSRTGPYMHNGVFELDGVINLYAVGMPTLKRKVGQENDPLFPTKSKLLHPLSLNAHERQDLIAFLNALEEPRLRVRPPTLPGGVTTKPSTEPVEEAK